MRFFHPRFLISGLFFLASACVSHDPVATTARLRLSLPQDASAFDWIRVAAEQNEVVTEGELDESLSVTFTLDVDVEATILATLLAHDPDGIYAYDGSTTFTPDPTTTDLVVDTPLVEPRSGTFVPTFVNGTVLVPNASYTITDDETGVLFAGSFATRQALSLPTGRSMMLSGTNPLTDYSWRPLNQGLSTLQFFQAASHPTDPNKIVGGMQDNATGFWNGGGVVPNPRGVSGRC